MMPKLSLEGFPSRAVIMLAVVALFTTMTVAATDWVKAQGAQSLRVQVEGRMKHMQPSQLETVVQPYLTQDFFSVDLDALCDEIAALPWVNSVSARRSWPDRILLRVNERRIAARWGDTRAIGADGISFDPGVVTLPDALPRLHGPEGAEKLLLEGLVEMGDIVAHAGYVIQALWIDERGAWHVDLKDDQGALVSLHMGRTDIDNRMKRFMGPVRKALGKRISDAAYVDLRYGNGFAVRWRDPEGQASDQKSG